MLESPDTTCQDDTQQYSVLEDTTYGSSARGETVRISIDPERYAWVTEILDNADHFPNFKALRVWERTRQGHSGAFQQALWHPPEKLQRQLQSRSLRIKARIRWKPA